MFIFNTMLNWQDFFWLAVIFAVVSFDVLVFYNIMK